MDTATEAALAQRLLEHIDAGTTALGPDRSSRPVDDYVSAPTYRLEVERVLRRCPAVVGHVAQLAGPGAFLTGSLYGVPYLVVAQPGGGVRAVVNACRHRGTRLVAAACGQAEGGGFSCPWHGWRYDLAGALTDVPDGHRGFPGLPAGEFGLLPVRAEVRHGLIWLTLAGDGPDVATHLGPLDEELRTFGLDDHLDYGGSEQVAGFNWKLGIEAFLETYHFRWLHPAMKKYVFAPDLSLVDPLASHVRLVAPKKSILDQRGSGPAALRLRPHATIAYCLFPTTMLFVEKRHVSVMSMLPVGPDRTQVRFRHLVGEDTLRRRPSWDENIQKFLDAAEEDFGALEAAQQGFGGLLEQADRPRVTFGRNEAGLQLFRAAVDRMLGPGDGR